MINYGHRYSCCASGDLQLYTHSILFASREVRIRKKLCVKPRARGVGGCSVLRASLLCIRAELGK